MTPSGRSLFMNASPWCRPRRRTSTSKPEKSTRKWCLFGAEKRISGMPGRVSTTAEPIRCRVSCKAREYVVANVESSTSRTASYDAFQSAARV